MIERRRTMQICNLYADEDGETHFRNLEIALTEEGHNGTTSRLLPAEGVVLEARLERGRGVESADGIDAAHELRRRNDLQVRARGQRQQVLLLYQGARFIQVPIYARVERAAQTGGQLSSVILPSASTSSERK